jgi:hypothetical protein
MLPNLYRFVDSKNRNSFECSEKRLDDKLVEPLTAEGDWDRGGVKAGISAGRFPVPARDM